LIEGKARVNDQTKEGLSALAFAADCGLVAGTTDCFNELLKAGARTDIKIGKTYKREWHRLRGLNTSLAHEVCRIGDVQKLDLLLRARADITALNDTGVPPLFEAACSGKMDCTRRLCEANASVQINHRSKTARWPNYPEKMCIASFMSMHCEKTIELLKQCRDVLGFGWDHLYMEDGQEYSLYPCWALSAYSVAYEDSVEVLEWCYDYGMPEDTWMKDANWYHPWGMVFLVGGLNTSMQPVIYKMMDKKMLPTECYRASPEDGEEGKDCDLTIRPWTEDWAIMSHVVGWDSMCWHYPVHNNYQILLAARGDEE